MAWPCGTSGIAPAATAVGGGTIEQPTWGEEESEGGGGRLLSLCHRGMEQQDVAVAELYQPSMADVAMPSVGKC